VRAAGPRHPALPGASSCAPVGYGNDLIRAPEGVLSQAIVELTAQLSFMLFHSIIAFLRWALVVGS